MSFFTRPSLIVKGQIYLLIFALSLIVAGSAFAGHATIFVYHKFEEPKSPSTSISIEVFEDQLDYLQKNNYNVIGLPELVTLLEDQREIPEKTVVLTIDDGYRSVYKKAFPILKKFGFPFTLFLYMEAVGRYPDYMRLDELQVMSRYRKVTFGNHSYSHARFGRMPEGITKRDYIRQIEDDLSRSEKRFNDILGYNPLYFAYPYGEYSKEYADTLKSRGYRVSLAQDPGSTGLFTDLFLIPRYAVVGSWARLDKIKEFLESEPLQLEDINPPYGILGKNPPSAIEGRVVNHHNYRNFGVYISEFGWKKPILDESSGHVSVKGLEIFKRKINRIGFTAINRITGKPASHFYMVTLPQVK